MTEETKAEQQQDEEFESYLENTGILPLFPTPLFMGQLKDMSLCDDLEKKILKMRDDKEGNFEAGNFITDDFLNAPGRGFEKFSEIVLNEADGVLNFLTVKRTHHYISGMWANVTNPNHRHPVHIHPNTLLSGILYLRTPDKCGGTVFTDPRPAARVFEPSYERMFEFNAGLYRNPPKRGQMLIWPSWLTHGVERGFCDNEKEERIVIAFNVMMLGTIDTHTARLELN